jgi:hypothetical protein
MGVFHNAITSLVLGAPIFAEGVFRANPTRKTRNAPPAQISGAASRA